MSGSDWSRREFLKSAAACGLAGALPVTWACRQTPQAGPNVLILFTDDQRYGTIRALGNPHIRTPHMDSLVQSGTAFTRAYIMGSFSGAVCMPSRAMLLTGRSLFHLKKQGGEIPREHRMLPEVFREAGYTTFGTGKWHNGRPAFARCFGAGDEIFFGGMSDHWNVPVYDYDPDGAYAARTPVISNPGASNQIQYRGYQHIVDGKHSSELFSDAAVSFLEHQHRGRTPFFLYVSYTAPHDPRTVPQEYLDMYDPESIPLPENFLPRHPFDNGELEIRDELLAGFPRTEAEVRRHLAEYYATITHLDDQIGRVLEALRRTGRFQDTLIVFAADNGLALGQHGLMGKQNLYEHSVHVPLILSGPGIPADAQESALCYLNDVFPTLCELAGLEGPAGIWGRSLAPVLKTEAPGPHEGLLFVYKDYQRAVLWDRWKLIRYRVGETFTTQLFDLEEDPWEMFNLAGRPEHRQRVSDLTSRLQDLMRRAGKASDWVFENPEIGDT
jgi:arylsulfatase A-like enzyme